MSLMLHYPWFSSSGHLGLSAAFSMSQKLMENLRLEKQRFRLLPTNLPMATSQGDMFTPMNQKFHWGWKSA